MDDLIFIHAADLTEKGSVFHEPVHVFNIDVKDNHEEAVIGAKLALSLATLVLRLGSLSYNHNLHY